MNNNTETRTDPETRVTRVFNEMGRWRKLTLERLATDTGWVVRCEGLPDMVVGDPAFLTEAVDSPTFVDSAARAALSFWVDDGSLACWGVSLGVREGV